MDSGEERSQAHVVLPMNLVRNPALLACHHLSIIEKLTLSAKALAIPRLRKTASIVICKRENLLNMLPTGRDR